MPAAQKALAEHGLRAEDVRATGAGGRLLKEDVLRHAQALPGETGKPSTPTAEQPKPVSPPPEPARASMAKPSAAGDREEQIVPMTRLRRTVAERLVQAQHTAALLTTFNEIDMSAILALRKELGEVFQAKFGVKLGFMSFFVKASVDALRLIPQVNAEMRGTEIVFHQYADIGVAIGGGKGLVVPVLRNAEQMTFSEIELAIADFAKRAKENKLTLEELQGGTFTISNGGVYGSLLSTPIVNPPQSGVLGMHAIQERPVARKGQVVIRPMMYVALTYDHRLVDGREAVTFLKRIKEVIENPARMLIET
jgi:2-oxoglutarate dehydrogenase E2 component (dihydrolipoamide succinyltransferase)